MRYVIGIDEAGCGALAGPVCVGAVLMPLDLDWRIAYALVTNRGEPRLRDSKQLSAQQREILYEYIITHGRLKHAAAFVDAPVIDSIGIVNATHEAAAVALSRIGVSPDKAEILLDAGLRVPDLWQQRSFIRGDETVPAISFASVIAKVTRDRLMESLPQHFESYKFSEHKGYGTLAHRKAIAKSGLSVLHRATFCTRLAHAGATAEIDLDD
ncbi:MAG: ribonuclease HII [Acidobacteriota bacterium]